ncbi:MAG: MATE family efflux transporter [Bacilli bacterium]|nr:MATE family efflux transporter [Bacilli bacterium]
MNKDLTVGKPSKVLWLFCIPLFLSVIFQQMYNIADSFVAGRFIGESALAAVGNSYEITLVFLAFAFGMNIGCSVIVSRYFGAKKYSDLKTSVYTTLITAGVLCVLLMAVGLLFSMQLLKLIDTPDAILEDSASYLIIYVWSLPFVFYYNIATGIYSALGDSKTPFVFLACSSVANIGMDILFVTGLRSVFARGVDGVAWATFICQGVSCILAVIVIFIRLSKIKGDGKAKPFSLSIFLQIIQVAIPSILQQSFISVGNVFIQKAINGFGSGVIAGYSAAIKLNNMVIVSFATIGNGISNYTSQNIGAGKLSRIHEGFKAGIKMMFYIAIPFVVLYCAIGQYVCLLFLDNTTGEASKTAITFLRIVSPFYLVISVKMVVDGILRGNGEMIKFTIATMADLILRVVLAFLFSYLWGSIGIWIAWPVGWCTAVAISGGFYIHDKWNKKKDVPQIVSE